MREMVSLVAEVATSYKLETANVNAALDLLRAGEAVPYIARYRKAQTGGMKVVPLRCLHEHVLMEAEFISRRDEIRHTLQTRDVLTPEVEQALLSAITRAALEDIYLPYASKRVSPAAHARAAGLLGLADALHQDSTQRPEGVAASYVKPEAGVLNVSAALQGARHILMERWAEDGALLALLRSQLWEHGVLVSQRIIEKKSKSSSKKNHRKEQKQAGWEAYVHAGESIQEISPRRLNMLFRGRREHALKLSLILPQALDGKHCIAAYVNVQDEGRAADAWLMEAVRLVWEKKLFSKLAAETMARLRDRSDDGVIEGLVKKFRGLLLTSPAPEGVIIGLYAERRQGLGMAVIDAQGHVLEAVTFFLSAPDNQWQDAITTLARYVARYDVRLIGLGQGQYARDTERLVSRFMARYPDMPCASVMVDVMGITADMTSDEAVEIMPGLTAIQRGAVSLARRLQNPLQAFTRTSHVSLSAGFAQHDVNPQRLARAFKGVLEDVVNAVGVDMNTADALLLRYVAGFNEARAHALTAYRETHGPFSTRMQLKDVPGMDAHHVQQAVGFLRLVGGEDALDATRIHPEQYEEVMCALKAQGLTLDDVLKDASKLDVRDERASTVRDALYELRAPGRDPRTAFTLPKAKAEGAKKVLSSLTVDMMLDGVVTRITTFGAFVDIGAEQPGLVHISAMTNRFVRDPHDVLHVGDEVRVRVLEVDKVRRRIGLSMKPKETQASEVKKTSKQKTSLPLNTAMADAFAKLKRSSS